MAPEGHGLQVLQDPDLGPKKATRPHQIRDAVQLLFMRFLPKCMDEAPQASRAPFGINPTSKNFLALEDFLCAKFNCILSSSLDFYREHTYTQTFQIIF